MEKSIHMGKEKTRSSRTKEIMVDIISYLFIFLFIYTAYNKATDYVNFSQSLSRYSILENYAIHIAWLIPAAEVFVSAWLLYPKTRLIGLTASLLLMILFTAFLLIMIYNTEFQYCSCGGVLNSLSATEHSWFNAGFIALAITGIFLSKKETQ